MKREDFVRLTATLVRSRRCGVMALTLKASHSIYVNRPARKTSTVPRHREINDFLAQKICKDLGIPTVGTN